MVYIRIFGVTSYMVRLLVVYKHLLLNCTIAVNPLTGESRVQLRRANQSSRDQYIVFLNYADCVLLSP